MNNEQINRAIHEALGKPLGCRRCSDPECSYNHGLNYCTDLNAMHEAEKTIYNHRTLWTAYYYAVGAGPFSLHVTARKKAEAFLKALGKWEDVQK